MRLSTKTTGMVYKGQRSLVSCLVLACCKRVELQLAMTLSKITISAMKTASKTFVPKSGLQTTTFPTVASSSRYYAVQCFQSEHSRGLDNAVENGGRATRPTVVISSDNDEIETVSGHVRV